MKKMSIPCKGERDKDFPVTSVYFCPEGDAPLPPYLPVWVEKQFFEVISYLVSLLENYMSL